MWKDYIPSYEECKLIKLGLKNKDIDISKISSLYEIGNKKHGICGKLSKIHKKHDDSIDMKQ